MHIRMNFCMNLHQYKTHMSGFFKLRRMSLLASFALVLLSPAVYGQDSTHLTLAQAITQGLDSSKTLRLSGAKVQEAIARYAEVRDKRLPQIKASFMASEAFIPTRKLQIAGLMKKPVRLPATSMLDLGTFGVTETIFGGNKLRYAETSEELLKKIATLNVSSDTQQVTLTIIQSYINLYKIDENLKIIARNLQDIQGRLEETVKFKNQGLATENDVLRFELQKANVELTRIDLENNRAVANYAMDVLLGMPETTVLKVDSIGHQQPVPPLQTWITEALRNRQDLATYQYQNKLSEVGIKNLKADKLPTLGAGFTTYYLNPNKQFFPPAHSFLVPMTLGLSLNWNISSLYTTKHKVTEARVRQQEVHTMESATADKIRMSVNKNYHGYLQTLQKIRVLGTAVTQARENDRIMELKYRNQLATTTDRIDAQTMLYQSLVNLGLAKADAAIAYYQLLRSAGMLSQQL
jgi:outer membrane protein TolC